MNKPVVLLDTVTYNTKPTRAQTGAITKRLQKAIKQPYSPQEIARQLVAGYTVVPSGAMSPEGFTGQQIWLVDVDGTVPLSENIKHKPAFAYSTYSDTDGSKYRLAFVSDTPVTDISHAKAIQEYFNSLCGGDKVCKNINRLYYGGKAIIYEDYESTFSPASITFSITQQPAKRQRRKNTPVAFDYKKHRQHVQAIELMDIEALKRLIGHVEPKTVDTVTELYQAANSINLAQYLGVPLGTMFNALTREDKVPSAHVYETDSGIQVYKDFGIDYTATAVKLTEKLTGVDTQTATEFIAAVFNITANTETEWQHKIREKYKYNQAQLEDDTFKINYPYTARLIRYDGYVIVKFAELAGEFARTEERTYNGMVTVLVSISKMAEYIGRSTTCTDEKIQHLNYLGFITKLHPYQCDAYTAMQMEELRKASVRANRKNPNSKTTDAQIKYINAYAVTILNESTLSAIESRARMLVENQYTKRGASREYMQRTFEKAANNFYPQYIAVNHKLSEKSTKWHKIISDTAKKLIDEQGYCTEQQIIDTLCPVTGTEEYVNIHGELAVKTIRKKHEGMGADFVKTQLKRSLAQLLKDNQWQRTRDKATRERLGLKPTRGAQPYIITSTAG